MKENRSKHSDVRGTIDNFPNSLDGRNFFDSDAFFPPVLVNIVLDSGLDVVGNIFGLFPQQTRGRARS